MPVRAVLVPSILSADAATLISPALPVAALAIDEMYPPSSNEMLPAAFTFTLPALPDENELELRDALPLTRIFPSTLILMAPGSPRIPARRRWR